MKVHTLSTAEKLVCMDQVVDVGAANKLTYNWTATTAASTFLLTGTMSVLRVE